MSFIKFNAKIDINDSGNYSEMELVEVLEILGKYVFCCYGNKSISQVLEAKINKINKYLDTLDLDTTIKVLPTDYAVIAVHYINDDKDDFLLACMYKSIELKNKAGK